MKRKNIIVLINGTQVEAWGNLKKACHAHGWHSAYWTIARKDLPFEHEGWKICRVPFQ